ncbi:Serine/threonine-protein kinase-like domain protein [Cordyceps fumosorosea ARSEF 2679]|uniref:Serine/threonine-protein kinase-like domain protein n=1 Tax=Cordyceps fumosorosea (strain ARSEF 2679) TaxID=1081104 RepID=A0A168BL21_CORFA|nr:Serine/threonine-protein kinase-like domain protein [Cordyceps fumosorosea ARSEF 2679]OAA70251.1 Serine/threonine-protein kinase-like domain protein [Cordyceps fumosorosea ARSEF 2679]
MAKNYEVPDFNEDDFFDWALEPLLPVLCEQTPWELKGKTATLNNALYAPIMEYTLEAVSDKLVLRPREEHAETQSMFGVSRPDGYQQWPGYLPSETLLDKNASYDSIPRKVILPDGSRGFFKIVGRGEKHTIETELNNYDRIRISQLPSSVRISRLLGLVRDECDTVFGLLLTYIDCGTVTLTCAVESGASDCQRQEWVAEVTQIISSLHKNGIVWGDAKPDNILIDQNQNAWIIYFGGGYSEAWVPKDLAGTMNGDLVALAKVVDYINGDLPFQSEKASGGQIDQPAA